MVNVIVIHHATAISESKINIPTNIPETFNIEERRPLINNNFVALAA